MHTADRGQEDDGAAVVVVDGGLPAERHSRPRSNEEISTMNAEFYFVWLEIQEESKGNHLASSFFSSHPSIHRL